MCDCIKIDNKIYFVLTRFTKDNKIYLVIREEKNINKNKYASIEKDGYVIIDNPELTSEFDKIFGVKNPEENGFVE